MYHFRILSIGKTKEAWLDDAIAEYLKRLQGAANIEFVLAKNDEQLTVLALKEEARGGVIALDEAGRLMDSINFSDFLVKGLESAGAKLAIVIGGPDGLPAAIKKKYPLVSLSPMTFTHQAVRLILIEQIYRALEIAKGSKYHRK